MHKLDTIKLFTAEEALDMLNTSERYIEVEGYQVQTRSQRYTLLRENMRCVFCGIEGQVAALQTNWKGKGRKAAHFNFYTTEQLKVLMTKDHIMPKSKGGPNEQWNYQTACSLCNSDKAAGLPVATRFLHPHAAYTAEEIAAEDFMRKKFGRNFQVKKA